MAAKSKKQSKIKLLPTPGYVVLKQASSEQKTESGIYLPESHEEKPQKGTVLAVGADEITDQGTKKASPVKVGDTVIYKKWGGNEVKLEDGEYLFCKFEDILAIVKS